ncbi:MAG: hypothetical protein QF886_25160, partial [Planctomycetota bacterium]|nr:hypothetical protein [Planctomycetota bacterium]
AGLSQFHRTFAFWQTFASEGQHEAAEPDEEDQDGKRSGKRGRKGKNGKKAKAEEAPEKKETPPQEPALKYKLYDLLDDPSESEDIAAEHPEVYKSMAATLEAWVASCRQSSAGKDYGAD